MSGQWPVKILLVHPQAPLLRKDKLVVAADCTVLVNGDIGSRFRNGETVIIGCPLLEDPDGLMKKLALVLRETTASEVEVYTMEVPCCHAIHMMTTKAIREAGREVKARHYIVRAATGNVEPYKPGVIDESMIEAERAAHGHG